MAPRRLFTGALGPIVRGRLIVLLGFVAVLGPLTIDLYLPAFPQMQEDLQTTPWAVQLTLTAATLGFALGQLVVGPWSDSIGRRVPLLVATGVHIAASIAIVAAPDIEWTFALRLLQGAGAAGSGVVAIAIVRDVFPGNELVRGLSRIALFTGIAPVIAPFLGAQLMSLLNWRGIFAVVAFYGMSILLIAAVAVPETHAWSGSTEVRLSLWRRSRALAADRAFVGVAFIGGCLVSSVFAMMTSAAFVFQGTYGLGPPAYGLISGMNAVAFVAGTQCAAFAARRLPVHRILTVALTGLTLTGFSLVLAPRFGDQPAFVVVAGAVFMVFAGCCGPCLGVLGLTDHGDQAATAAAVMGAVNYGFAGVAAPIVGALGVTTFAPLGLVMGSLMGAAGVIYWALVRPRSELSAA